MVKTAQYWIDRLNLIPHPEGGYYRETYRSELVHRQGGIAATVHRAAAGFHGNLLPAREQQFLRLPPAAIG